MGPVGPVGPAVVAPVAPVEPVGPVGPVGPAGPVGPVAPVEPVIPPPPRLLVGYVNAANPTRLPALDRPMGYLFLQAQTPTTIATNDRLEGVTMGLLLLSTEAHTENVYVPAPGLVTSIRSTTWLSLSPIDWMQVS